MKQPQRLIETGSPNAKALLSSLDEDVPPDLVGGQERILRALEVAPTSSTSIPVVRPAASRRWIPIASMCGLVVASAAIFAVSQREGSSPRSVAEPSGEVTSAPTGNVVATAAPAVSEAAPVVDVHALASAPVEAIGDTNVPRGARSGVRRDVGNAPTPIATGASESTDELQLLERAQAAAARGQGEEALALVARHRREFPRGRFAVEMSVVEVEALARAGRVDEAAARGERFLASHPGSPYTRRVEAVVRARGQKEQPR